MDYIERCTQFNNLTNVINHEYVEIKRKKDEAQDNTEKIKCIVREFLNLNEPTPEIMKVIINRIEIIVEKNSNCNRIFENLLMTSFMIILLLS